MTKTELTGCTREVELLAASRWGRQWPHYYRSVWLPLVEEDWISSEEVWAALGLTTARERAYGQAALTAAMESEGYRRARHRRGGVQVRGWRRPGPVSERIAVEMTAREARLVVEMLDAHAPGEFGALAGRIRKHLGGRNR